MSRIWGKLKGFLKGWEKINDNLYVYTPIVIPFHDSAFVRRINRTILTFSLRIIQQLLKLDDPVLPAEDRSGRRVDLQGRGRHRGRFGSGWGLAPPQAVVSAMPRVRISASCFTL